MVATLEDFHNPELVFRENLGKTIGGLHLFPGLIPITGSQRSPGKDILAKTYLSGDLLGNGDMIPGHHFHVHAMFFCFGDRGCSILPGRIEKPDQAKILPCTVRSCRRRRAPGTLSQQMPLSSRPALNRGTASVPAREAIA